MKKKNFDSKELLDLYMYINKFDYAYMSYIDSEGNKDVVYLFYFKYYDKDNKKYQHSYIHNYCELISHNEKHKMTKEEIKESIRDYGMYELFNDGVLYEVDAWHGVGDFIKFPITEAEFINEEKACRMLYDMKRRSFFSNFVNSNL